MPSTNWCGVVDIDSLPGIGGQDHGHKGFGLGLMVEALTIGQRLVLPTHQTL